ncbi:MAG: hypothetical protein U0838_04830 [Chloroflexota bacterium]
MEQAVASGEVDHVIAHTLPGPNPSTGVLVALGFEHRRRSGRSRGRTHLGGRWPPTTSTATSDTQNAAG